MLQAYLLRAALLLGVHLHCGYAADVVRVEPARLACTQASTQNQREFAFDSLVVASGAANQLRCQDPKTGAPVPLVQYQEQGTSQVLGLVMHFEQHHTVSETQGDDFAKACQFDTDFFNDLSAKTGVAFENLVKYREQDGDTHYVVATPKKAGLVQLGVLTSNHPDLAQLLHRDNIDSTKLETLANAVRQHLGLPADCKLAKEAGGAALFDFSRRRNATQACYTLPSTTPNAKSMVYVVGDSLVEPCEQIGKVFCPVPQLTVLLLAVWPEGLGINRGIHGVLDTVRPFHHCTVLRKTGLCSH